MADRLTDEEIAQLQREHAGMTERLRDLEGTVELYKSGNEGLRMRLQRAGLEPEEEHVPEPSRPVEPLGRRRPERIMDWQLLESLDNIGCCYNPEEIFRAMRKRGQLKVLKQDFEKRFEDLVGRGCIVRGKSTFLHLTQKGKNLMDREADKFRYKGEQNLHYYIFDLDDTLADTSRRKHLVPDSKTGTREDWRRYYEACVTDTPKRVILGLYDLLVGQSREHARSRVQIWTGRSEEVRRQTVDWLRIHTHPHSREEDFSGEWPSVVKLRMRPERDYRPDYAIKREWLGWIIPEKDPNSVTVTAFDDRNQSVAMWREAGITCLQVAPGNF